MTELSLNGGKYMYVGPSIPTDAAKAIQDAINLAYEIREKEHAANMIKMAATAGPGQPHTFTCDPAKAYGKPPETPESKTDEHKFKDLLLQHQKRMAEMRAEIAKGLLESVQDAKQVGPMFVAPSGITVMDDTLENREKLNKAAAPVFEAMGKSNVREKLAEHKASTAAEIDKRIVQEFKDLNERHRARIFNFVNQFGRGEEMAKSKIVVKCTRKIEEENQCSVTLVLKREKIGDQVIVLGGLAKAGIDEFTVGESYRLQFKPVATKPEPSATTARRSNGPRHPRSEVPGHPAREGARACQALGSASDRDR